MEGNTNGWPLGLGNITSQLAAPPPALRRHSSSFSSFSSSNLETESTASFFADQSVSLGRLIGIEAISNKRRLQCGNGGNVANQTSLHVGLHNSSQPISCAPFFHYLILKINGPSPCTSTK